MDPEPIYIDLGIIILRINIRSVSNIIFYKKIKFISKNLNKISWLCNLRCIHVERVVYTEKLASFFLLSPAVSIIIQSAAECRSIFQGARLKNYLRRPRAADGKNNRT